LKRILITFLLMSVLLHWVQAEDVMDEQARRFGVDSLTEGLEDHAQEVMEDYDPTVQADLIEGVSDILTDAVRQSGSALKATSALMLKLLGILLLCRLASGMEDKRIAAAASLAGAMAIAACSFSDLRSMIGLGNETMEQLSGFSTLLLPVMAASSAASGGAVSSGAVYSAAALFSNLLIRFCRSLLIPLVYGYLALAMTDSALGTSRLAKLQELIGWGMKNGLKLVVYCFTGFLTATKLIGSAADAAALKAAKMTVSTAIPVVGGILSGAADTLLAGAGLLRSAAGTFGMLAILAIFLLPFLQMGISYLGFKLAAALGGVLDGGQNRLLEGLTGAMGFMLAMVGSCALICLYACCCFLRTVTV